MKSAILGFAVALIAIAHVSGEAKLRSTNKANNAPSFKLMNLNDFDEDTQQTLGRQAQQIVRELNEENARKDTPQGRLFLKKFMTFGQSSNQQPTIIPIIITQAPSSTGTTNGGTVTSTGTITGTGTITTTPTGRGNEFQQDDASDENQQQEYVIDEEEINEDNAAMGFDDEEKAANGKKKNGVRRKGVSFVIPPQYRKFFNNQKRLVVPVNMIQNGQKAGNGNGNRINLNKKRRVRRKGVRKN